MVREMEAPPGCSIERFLALATPGRDTRGEDERAERR